MCVHNVYTYLHVFISFHSVAHDRSRKCGVRQTYILFSCGVKNSKIHIYIIYFVRKKCILFLHIIKCIYILRFQGGGGMENGNLLFFPLFNQSNCVLFPTYQSIGLYCKAVKFWICCDLSRSTIPRFSTVPTTYFLIKTKENTWSRVYTSRPV